MSRLADIIKRVESGERIDWGKENQLMTLDLARISEEFAEEALQRHRESDESIKRTAATQSQDGGAV